MDRRGSPSRCSVIAPSSVPSPTWTQTVLRDYVLPELKPDVIINWLR